MVKAQAPPTNQVASAPPPSSPPSPMAAAFPITATHPHMRGHTPPWHLPPSPPLTDLVIVFKPGIQRRVEGLKAVLILQGKPASGSQGVWGVGGVHRYAT